jgi:hypothetical protein
MKILYLVLAILMSATILSGCGGGSGKSDDPCQSFSPGISSFSSNGVLYPFKDVDTLPDGSFRYIGYTASPCVKGPIVLGTVGSIVNIQGPGVNGRYRIGNDNYMTLVSS